LAIGEDYVYVAAGEGGLRVVDITDPTKPTEISRYNPSESANDVSVDGNFVYIADGSWGLRVIDISDPAMLREVGAYKTTGAEYSGDVYIHGDHLFLARGWNYGAVIIDISQPDQPTEILAIEDNFSTFAVKGEFMFSLSMGWLYANWLCLPACVIEIAHMAPLYNFRDTIVKDDLIYATDQENGLLVLSLDTSNLLLPRVLLPMTMSDE
jgi:hypothetical protein